MFTGANIYVLFFAALMDQNRIAVKKTTPHNKKKKRSDLMMNLSENDSSDDSDANSHFRTYPYPFPERTAWVLHRNQAVMQGTDA